MQINKSMDIELVSFVLSEKSVPLINLVLNLDSNNHHKSPFPLI
jgi:hypothetical protein